MRIVTEHLPILKAKSAIASPPFVEVRRNKGFVTGTEATTWAQKLGKLLPIILLVALMPPLYYPEFAL